MLNLEATRSHSFNRYTTITLAEYFWDRVDKSPGHGPRGDCWIWTGSRNKDGYGTVQFKAVFDNARPYSHRVSWLLETGAMPTLLTCHSCDYPPCVRFVHLFQGTNADNCADMKRKGRGNGPHFLGESHPMHKLTDDKVIEIRKLYATGDFSIRRLAATHGVAFGTIQFITSERTWKHLIQGGKK